ncbi:G-type lectin S-receptor-like serine/threonine-protein kinase At4g27290 isoform X3 [Manihot esculenta]|uniref:G-type lectin S-receptor-like serine/threonine-protein kinase At4g27290 isoform X3 n=1 Tax=Manihot esculenta TaxID=3983 RepID=UPI000B5D4A28|nr:G-type lectin S-receptor-like serine/threonine-protein kinase At4g27290 isoform X3 [Manihot esculenta]
MSMDTASLAFLGTATSLVIFLFKFSTALDTITPSQSLSDGETLVSREGTFELGFFSLDDSEKRYLGIWYGNIPSKTVVWVANRNNPINGSSGLLTINSTGNPVLLSDNRTVVWSVSNLTKEAQEPILQLLDSGNFVLRNKNGGDLGIYLWQSFDYPCDTLLPGMKLGWDSKSGLNRHLSSWRSPTDPSPGDFMWEVQLHSNPEAVMWKGTEKYYRSGPWNGIAFSGGIALRPNPVFGFNFVSTEEEIYYKFNLNNESLLTRIVMNQTTYNRERYTWNDVNRSWSLYDIVPRDRCDSYGLCGAYGNCIVSELPVCQCLKGFKPRSLETWNLKDWSQGCMRNKPLNCETGDGFLKFSGLKLPDTTHSWVNKTMNLRECRATCLKNCSCMAYSSSDIRGGGSGCAIWFGDLMDMRQLPADGGQELYIRMNASETEGKAKPKMKIAIITVAAIAMVSGMLIVSFAIYKRKTKSTEQTSNNTQNNQDNEDIELPLFGLPIIVNSTNNFSINKKIGEGGFGPVYRGKLIDGQEIAVKRLSRTSGQGLNEFKNEVIFIAKLQHRNLVKLLGCCIQGEERMLVYEYMPNKSLDSFIFDKTRSRLLDWAKRFNIICGIARGLLYLHQDSRLRIIHRDLKASNILLDNEMNPKISDFGMAKTVGGEQTEGNTNRVVGTYGYMAPEYATDGIFSDKSDVFSFGILILEIISGKKSRGYHHPDHSHNLIGHKGSRALGLEIVE